MPAVPPRFGAALRAAVIGVALGAAGLPATALADAEPAQVIAAVNAERARDGIPAGIVENAEWSRGCALHNAYRRRNGVAATAHDEDPALPGYTPEGDAAGNSSVLATLSWSAGNPFATAPIHLMQLMSPRIQAMGVDDTGGLVCVSTFRGDGPVAESDVVYASPGEGRRDVPVSEEARESPFVPAQFLASPPPAVTGPHILVLADGPFSAEGPMRIVAARLEGPSGPVEVQTIDESEPRIADYIPPGGMVIPTAPLATGTLYTAGVTVEGAAGVRLTHTWSFRTAGPVPAVGAGPSAAAEAAACTGTAPLRVSVHGRRLTVWGPHALHGRRVRVVVSRGRAVRRRTVVLRPSAVVALRRSEVRTGTRITVRAGGFSAGGVRWSVPPVRTTVDLARR